MGTQIATRRCANCRTFFRYNGQRACPRCGAPIEDEPTTTSAPAPPPPPPAPPAPPQEYAAPQPQTQHYVSQPVVQQPVYEAPPLLPPQPAPAVSRQRARRSFRPRWRIMTWIILIVNVLFLIWIISGIAATSGSCTGLQGVELDACETGTAIGASIGIGAGIFLWVAADLILGIIWLVTRKPVRMCPACGRKVKTGLTACSSCGYNFAALRAY